eukprot:3851744-Rhodomonas_salina.1
MAKAARKEDAQGKKQAALQLCRETARTAADAEEVVQGETALMRASVRGDASGVQLLIEAGADARREVSSTSWTAVEERDVPFVDGARWAGRGRHSADGCCGERECSE